MAGLTLLHPWLLIGIAGASLPILIHLIGRRRAPTIFFAAFDFLAAVNKRLARRERLRQLLLLLLRTLAILALVFAVARPLARRVAAATTGSRRVVLVLDASASMAYELHGRTLFAHAKEQARDVLSHLQPGDAVTVVAAGPDVRALLQAPTVDLARARAAVDSLQLGGGTADLAAAMESGLAQFGSGGSQSVVIISDLAENSFRGLRPTALDPPPEVRLLDAAERERPEALGNVAIESVTIEAGAGASERRIKVMVHNYGATAVSDRSLELVLNGEVTERGRLDVAARSVQEKVYTHAFAAPGLFDGEVRLSRDDADGYPKDDVAFFGVEVVPGVRLLAVDGDVRATPYEDELFFAERALGTVPKGDAPIELRIVSADELAAGADLAGFDVIILANVGALPRESIARLTAFVDEGGGLLFTLGDKVPFEQANDLFGALLPHPLRDVHLAADPAAGTPPLGIGGIDWDHPIMHGLGAPVEESLRASRTARYFNLDVGADRKTRAVLRFDNGAPALCEARRQGKGRVMLLTTSIDLDLSDLALRSAYPAVLQRTVRYLAKAVEGQSRAAVREGAEIDLALPTGAEALSLTSPSGTRLAATVAAGRAHVGGLVEPGFYRAEVTRGSQLTREPRLDVAVSPSLAESDFAPIRPAQVATALGNDAGGRAVDVAFGAAGDGDPFAARGFGSLLLIALCLFFVSESLLASRG